jgi:lipoprotein-releasing system permease protein
VKLFEFSVASKYLIPRKGQLSVSLIALMSVTVISLVVWLLLVFLSVTDGIEKSWLEKLTSLNAPLRITPKEAYFNSYYYQIDSVSAASNYSHKTLKEKALAALSDPYDEESDMEIPPYWQAAERNKDGSLKDPVKTAFATLTHLQKEIPDLRFQDYEMSGGLLRLQMRRPESASMTTRGPELERVLTQASYVASFADQNPSLSSLIIPPGVSDLNHLYYLAATEKDKTLEKRLAPLVENSCIKELKTSAAQWRIPVSLLPEKKSFAANARIKNGQIQALSIPTVGKGNGILTKVDNQLHFTSKEGSQFKLSQTAPLFLDGEICLKATLIRASLSQATQLQEVGFTVSGSLQNIPLSGEIYWDNLEISKADIQTHFDKQPTVAPLWPYTVNKQLILPKPQHNTPAVLLAKSFKDTGVKIGDRGYVSYSALGAGSMQEQRSPIYVSSFYDPGVMSIGSKCILGPAEVVHTLSSSMNSYAFDKTDSMGIQIWFKDLKQTEALKQKLLAAFQEQGIDGYWKISTYRDYDFAKDILQQFQSDKMLFSLIGVIILVVACCNIISLLTLLVNDKKKEIGILQAMGASRLSIAMIFGSCGVFMGMASSLLGVIAALLTLHNIDAIASFLSFVQGHEMFNTLFYGNSLPHELSSGAILFVLIVTPILSLCAGLIPAIKACRLQPSAILRSE